MSFDQGLGNWTEIRKMGCKILKVQAYQRVHSGCLYIKETNPFPSREGLQQHPRWTWRCGQQGRAGGFGAKVSWGHPVQPEATRGTKWEHLKWLPAIAAYPEGHFWGKENLEHTGLAFPLMDTWSLKLFLLHTFISPRWPWTGKAKLQLLSLSKVQFKTFCFQDPSSLWNSILASKIKPYFT